MEYKIITDEQGFLNEKETWNSICKAMPDSTPFQTWEWSYIWWKNNEPEDSLYIIKAFQNSKVYGYAPIVVKDNNAEFIGGRDMDYGRFIVFEKEMPVIEGFLDLLLSKKFSLSLQEMNSRNTQLHMVQKILENKKKCLVHQTTRTSYVDILRYKDFSEYYKLLSQSMRNKTIKVGLKKCFDIKKEPVTNALLSEIEDIYINRQDVRGGAADISWSFPIICQMNSAGLLNVYIARDGNQAIGFLVSMFYNNSQFIWLVAFKNEYKNSFPGQLLFYKSVKDGFDESNAKVDFMRGDYDFKMRWECSLDTNYSVFVYNSWLKYKKSKMWFALRPKIKRFVYNHKAIKRMYVSRAK